MHHARKPESAVQVLTTLTCLDCCFVCQSGLCLWRARTLPQLVQGMHAVCTNHHHPSAILPCCTTVCSCPAYCLLSEHNITLHCTAADRQCLTCQLKGPPETPPTSLALFAWRSFASSFSNAARPLLSRLPKPLVSMAGSRGSLLGVRFTAAANSSTAASEKSPAKYDDECSGRHASRVHVMMKYGDHR